MSDTPTIAELVAINLRYDGSAAALNIRAQAQLAAKLLFAGGRAVSQPPSELAKAGAKALGIKTLSVASIEAGLTFLADLRLARQSGERWLLTDKGYDTIGYDVDRSRSRLANVLQRHFPGRLDQTALETWFNEACVAFYGLYGTQWAAALARQTARKPLTASALNSATSDTILRSSLKGDSEALLTGFHSFLNSQDQEDIEHQWSLGQSMLAARLVAANIGPDPITATDFRDSLLLLDTNTLLVAALESHRLTDSLAQLEVALQALHVTLGRIEDTRDEYTRAVRGRMDSTLSVVGEYSLGVLRNSGDPFILTALDRHCTNLDDFRRFFDELLDPPRELPHGTPIEALHEPEIEELAKRGRTDTKLKSEIEGVWARLRGRKKGTRATEHDAALTAVAEGLMAARRKCAVLTLDRTMHEHALQRAGEHAPPLWISLDALIQVLAADSSGPDIDPAAFAPLMASIIRHQCEPVLNTYNTEDLGLLLDIEERCAALPEPSVSRIASMVSRARLSGKHRSDPELQLQVKRAFQNSKIDENADLRDMVKQSYADIRTRDSQLTHELKRRRRTRQALIETRARELRRQANLRAAARTGVYVVGAGLFGFVAYLLTIRLLPQGTTADIISFFLTIGTPAIGLGTAIWQSILPEWRSSLQSSEELATEEADELEEDTAT